MTFNPEHKLPFWDKQPPSRTDILIVLFRALDLLADSLPIALENIGDLPLDEQLNFWRSYVAFDKITDLELGDERYQLSRWSEVAQIRIEQPDGVIE